MIPVSYIMVDLGGIDLADVKGNVYPGLYNKIYSSLNACQEVVLCNWFVAGILIPPTYCAIDISVSGTISFNDMIFIHNDDTIEIPTMGTTPKILSLSVQANDTYYAPEGFDGYNPVTVDVSTPPPVLDSIEIYANGTYYPGEGVDGFDSVEVNVPDVFLKYPPMRSVTSDSIFSQVVSGLGQPRPECAFGEDTKNWWGAANNGQHWIEFELISQYSIKNIMFSNYFNIGSSTWASNSVIFQGSQNGTDWTSLLELTNLQNDSAQQTHSIENGTQYLFYRFICQSSSTFYTGLGKIQFN